MTHRSPETALHETPSKTPEVPIVVVERDIDPDDTSDIEDELQSALDQRLEKLDADVLKAKLLQADSDAFEARQAEMDALFTTSPQEPEMEEMKPIKHEPWWSLRTFGALKTEAGIVSLPKWLGYKGSAMLTGVENWGKEGLKKNMPWLSKI